MPITTSQVFDYLDKHPLRKYPGDFESLLDMLHWTYTESNPIDSQTVHSAFQDIHSLLRELPGKKEEEFISSVCRLCLEYERLSFSHGILVGMLLMTELNGLS